MSSKRWDYPIRKQIEEWDETVAMSPKTQIWDLIYHAIAELKEREIAVDKNQVVHYLSLALALATRWRDEDEN